MTGFLTPPAALQRKPRPSERLTARALMGLNAGSASPRQRLPWKQRPCDRRVMRSAEDTKGASSERYPCGSNRGEEPLLTLAGPPQGLVSLSQPRDEAESQGVHPDQRGGNEVEA